jgi:hypothetical protein
VHGTYAELDAAATVLAFVSEDQIAGRGLDPDGLLVERCTSMG